MRPLEILLLCHRPPAIAATLEQHLSALQNYSRHRVRAVSIYGQLPRDLELERFDVIVIHWSLIAASDAFVSPETRARIARAPALKVAFVQDEYRFVNRTIAALAAMDLHVLLTCVPPEEIEKVYPAHKLPGVAKVNVLTGYVHDELLGIAPIPYEQRPLDVGYRARKLSAWMGELAAEKWRISERFAADAPKYGLTVDLSAREEDRIYGDAWLSFIRRCRAMLGVESGVSVIDFDGTLQATVEAAEAANPTATFEELREQHFKDLDGRISLAQISPRCFEAAALRTLMILYEGDYSGRLVPWRHYVPLKKDHSNMDAVVAVLRDPVQAQAIIEHAYQEVALDPRNGFRAAIADFDAVIDANIGRVAGAQLPPYAEAAFAAISGRVGLAARLHRIETRLFTLAHRFVYGVLLRHCSEATRRRWQGMFRAARRGMRTVLGRTE